MPHQIFFFFLILLKFGFYNECLATGLPLHPLTTGNWSLYPFGFYTYQTGMDMQGDLEEGEKENWERQKKSNKSESCPTGTVQLRGPSRRAKQQCVLHACSLACRASLTRIMGGGQQSTQRDSSRSSIDKTGPVPALPWLTTSMMWLVPKTLLDLPSKNNMLFQFWSVLFSVCFVYFFFF